MDYGPTPEQAGLVESDTDPGFFGAVRDVFLGAQSTIGGLGDNVQGVFTGAQGTIGAVVGGGIDATRDVFLGGQETIRDVASPWNLFGLGAGLGAGGIAVTGLSVVAGAAIADEVFTGGAGRTALLQLVKRKRR